MTCARSWMRSVESIKSLLKDPLAQILLCVRPDDRMCSSVNSSVPHRAATPRPRSGVDHSGLPIIRRRIYGVAIISWLLIARVSGSQCDPRSVAGCVRTRIRIRTRIRTRIRSDSDRLFVIGRRARYRPNLLRTLGSQPIGYFLISRSRESYKL